MWTPCIERQPEKNDVYIVTFEDDDDPLHVCEGFRQYRIDTGWKTVLEKEKVLTWMPVPDTWSEMKYYNNEY